jgi:hypothetical protein
LSEAHDPRAEEGRCIWLGHDGDREIWLDFATGAVESWPPMPRVNQGRASPPKLMDTVVRAMARREIVHARDTPDILKFVVESDHGPFAFTCVTNDEACLVTLIGNFAARIPAARRLAVAEAITRINFVLGFGALEMDFADGELRHVVTLDVEEGLLSPKMVDNMLGCAFITMDRYHDAIMRVAFGDIDPVVALAEVEDHESRG